MGIKKKNISGRRKPASVRILADEASAWSAVSSIAQDAYNFWKTFLILRRGSDSTDALTSGDDQEFLYAIRAVSWVESAHGTGGGISAARDPMQCGNPADSWWKQLTGAASKFDRFVRGGDGTKNYSSNELPSAVVSNDGWNTNASLSNLTDQAKGHGTKNDDNGFTPTISYWWAIPHLIWDINAGHGGRPAYQCSDALRADMKAGCVDYNGGGDTNYAAKIDAAYDLFAGSQVETRDGRRLELEINNLKIASATAEHAVAAARRLAPTVVVEARVRVGSVTAEIRLEPE